MFDLNNSYELSTPVTVFFTDDNLGFEENVCYVYNKLSQYDIQNYIVYFERMTNW